MKIIFLFYNQCTNKLILLNLLLHSRNDFVAFEQSSFTNSSVHCAFSTSGQYKNNFLYLNF